MKKLATAGSLEELRKLIAEFYCTTPDRISTVQVAPNRWKVLSGSKPVSPIVVSDADGWRYTFGMEGARS